MIRQIEASNLPPVVFTSDLDRILFTGLAQESEITVDVDGVGEVFNQKFIVPDSGNLRISMFGEIIRSALAENELSAAKVNVTVQGGSGCSFTALRSDIPMNLSAEEFSKDNFLTAAKGFWFPLTELNRYSIPYRPGVAVYAESDPGPARLEVIRDNGTSDHEPLNSQYKEGVYYYIPTYTTFTNFLGQFTHFEGVLTVGTRKFYIASKPAKGGVLFFFRNAFGVQDQLYLPGVVSRSSDKTSTQVIRAGQIEEIAPRAEETYSVSAESVPYWLAVAAQALLTASYVEVVEDRATPFPFGENIQVTVSAVTGTLHNSPASLSSVKISYKPINTVL